MFPCSTFLSCHRPCNLTGDVSVATGSSSVVFWVYVCVCVCSAFHVQAHRSHSPGFNGGVGDWGEHFFFFFLLLLPVVQLLFLSALSSPLRSRLVLSFYFYFISSFLLSFFPPITELGPGCLDQCHHSGWQRGRAQRFPRWLNGLCGCLSSFWVFSHWLSPHLGGELTKIDVGSTSRMLTWTIRQIINVILDPFPWQIGVRWQQFGVRYYYSDDNIVTHSLSGILLSLSLPTNCLPSDYWS